MPTQSAAAKRIAPRPAPRVEKGATPVQTVPLQSAIRTIARVARASRPAPRGAAPASNASRQRGRTGTSVARLEPGNQTDAARQVAAARAREGGTWPSPDADRGRRHPPAWSRSTRAVKPVIGLSEQDSSGSPNTFFCSLGVFASIALILSTNACRLGMVERADRALIGPASETLHSSRSRMMASVHTKRP